MASNIAQMQVDAVNAAIANFDARNHEFQDVVNTLKAAMFDVSGTWTGKAEQTFEAQCREMFNNLSTVMTSVEGAKEKLKLAIDTYAENEGLISGSVNAIDITPVPYVEG